MSLDDRARDGEAQPAVAAERLAVGAFAVEAAEDCLALRGGNAGAVVVDAHMHLVAQAGRGDAGEDARRREADRFVDDMVDGALEAEAVAHHRHRSRTWAVEADDMTGTALCDPPGAPSEHRVALPDH